ARTIVAQRAECAGRVAAMEQRLTATLTAVQTVKPALAKFYDLLSDEQKARFNALRAGDRRHGEPRGRRDSRREGRLFHRHQGRRRSDRVPGPGPENFIRCGLPSSPGTG